jgi:hypothetical protein
LRKEISAAKDSERRLEEEAAALKHELRKFELEVNTLREEARINNEQTTQQLSLIAQLQNSQVRLPAFFIFASVPLHYGVPIKFTTICVMFSEAAQCMAGRTLV